jgi:tetratricopeptide (TPR) repeat protein
MNCKENRRMLKIKVFENAQSFFERQFSAGDVIRIGRAPHCELPLDSKRVSREHGRIYHADGAWHIEDLKSQNGIRLNGTKITSEKLQHNDVVQIGDYRMEIAISPVAAAPFAVAPSTDDDRTVLLGAPPESDKTVVAGGFSSPGQAPEGLAGKIAALPPKTKILAGVLAAAVLFLLIIAIIPSSQDTADPEKTIVAAEQEKTATMMDAESRHQMEIYLQSGREQFDAGNYTEALVRFQAVLNMDPQHTEALEYLRRSRDKMREMEELRRIAAEEEQQRMARVGAIVSQARQAFRDADYDKASEMLAEAEFLAPQDASIQSLKAEIETARKDKKARRAEALDRQQENHARLKQHFEKGQQYHDQGRYFEALQEWNQVLALNMDTPESAHVRHAIVHLKKLLEEDARRDYDKAKTAFQNKDYTRTMAYLEKVVIVLPDHQEAKKMMAEATREVEARARQLYQEGLVFEGIGQRERAVEKWREVLRVMPIEDNAYHQRALDKLK